MVVTNEAWLEIGKRWQKTMRRDLEYMRDMYYTYRRECPLFDVVYDAWVSYETMVRKMDAAIADLEENPNKVREIEPRALDSKRIAARARPKVSVTETDALTLKSWLRIGKRWQRKLRAACEQEKRHRRDSPFLDVVYEIWMYYQSSVRLTDAIVADLEERIGQVCACADHDTDGDELTDDPC